MTGALELLTAVGLILPALLGVAPVLVPLAATGLVLTMIGAAVVHARRKEYSSIGGNVVLLILAVVVAWGWFGRYSF
ncbi:DoxX family protein [Actinoplanes flavus]|uniref:DoxX family protein n=1 Tax=Actinoplanes flavus TaxID=2820290 RepID=A0ABS3UX79_9ACTN|nr:DoxX family protein [Actinoplanes flavus]MBO3743198.1 DoxX family protein [Actinoplanes flavus]